MEAQSHGTMLAKRNTKFLFIFVLKGQSEITLAGLPNAEKDFGSPVFLLRSL